MGERNVLVFRDWQLIKKCKDTNRHPDLSVDCMMINL